MAGLTAELVAKVTGLDEFLAGLMAEWAEWAKQVAEWATKFVVELVAGLTGLAAKWAAELVAK